MQMCANLMHLAIKTLRTALKILISTSYCGPCRLAELCNERLSEYQGKFQNLAAGTIINTMGWVEGQGKEAQAAICKAFGAEIILVIGDDKLHSALQLTFQVQMPAITVQSVTSSAAHTILDVTYCKTEQLCSIHVCVCAQAWTCSFNAARTAANMCGRRVQERRDTQVVKLPQSGGTVQLHRDAHKQLRDAAIKDYFLGRVGEMAPSLQQVKLSAVKVFRVAGSMGSQAGLLPAGMQAALVTTRLTPMDATDELVRAACSSSKLGGV